MYLNLQSKPHFFADFLRIIYGAKNKLTCFFVNHILFKYVLQIAWIIWKKKDIDIVVNQLWIKDLFVS